MSTQAPQAIELIRGDGPPAEAPDSPITLIAGSAVLGVAFVVLVSLHVRAIRFRRLPAAERAFRRLAKARGIRPRRRRLVRALAEMHNDVEPVALLASDTAMRTAIERFRKRDAKPPAGTSIEDLASLMPREHVR